MSGRWFALYRMHVRTMTVYRFQMLTGLMGNAVSLLGYMMLWLYSLDHGKVNLPFSRSEVLIYYILAFFVGALYSDEIAFRIGEDIDTGRLSGKLLLPAKYMTLTFAEYCAFISVYGVFMLVGAAVLTVVYQKSALALLCFMLQITMSVCFYFFYIGALGLISVWYRQSSGVIYLQQLVVALLSGSVIPLNLVSKSPVLQRNPFAMLVYVPIRSFLENGTDLKTMGIMGGYTLLAMLAYCAVYRRAMKAYQAFGG